MIPVVFREAARLDYVTAWDKMWDAGRGNNARIPYSLAIDDNDPNRDAILAAAREYESMVTAGAKRH